MGQVQQKTCHHNCSVKLLREPRSQVYSLTIAIIALCNNLLQNSVAKDIYGSIGSPGHLCFIVQVYGSGSSPRSFILPEPEEGFLGHVLLKVMAEAQE